MRAVTVRSIMMGLVACLMAQAMVARAQSDRFADVVIEATQVTETVYMLTGAGGNIGVSVGPDGLLIIDDQFAPLAERIAEALGRVAEGQSFPGAMVKYVINTHFHGDHTGSNGFFAEQGATIVAQENVRVRLLGSENNPQTALPVVTYSEGVNLYFNSDKLLLDALAGHTDGDSSVFFTRANVLHTGDLLFNGRFPYIDLDNGGSVADYLASQRALLALVNEQTQIIPGHGPLASSADLLAMHTMIKACYEQVRADVDAGLSLEDIIEKGVAPRFQSLSGAFINEERWLTTLYRDITRG